MADFQKVSIEEVKVGGADKYGELHDAILVMPTFTGETGALDVLKVPCANEKEARNTVNSVRTFARRHKKEFSIKTSKTDKDFEFIIKKLPAKAE